MSNRPARIGWVVDAQNDFSKPQLPGGRLYVKILSDTEDQGAVLVEENLVRTVEWMRGNCDVVVFTMDAHRDTDAEINDVDPDFVNTYPRHCMHYSADPAEREGAAIIPEIRPANPVILGRDATEEDARRVAREAAQGAEVVIEKSQFNVFTGNPVTGDFLAWLKNALGTGELEFVVAGHAMDVCVNQAVGGLRGLDYPVTIVEDAMYGLGLEPKQAILERWQKAGVQVTSSARLAPLPA